MPIIMGVRFRPKLMSGLDVQTGTFSPGRNQRGVSDAPAFLDAADDLLHLSLVHIVRCRRLITCITRWGAQQSKKNDNPALVLLLGRVELQWYA